MHIFLLILLVAVFAYSLALVMVNNASASDINFLFWQPPSEVSLGMVLVATIFLGVLIGVLLALLLFRVLQNKWEIARLKKEINQVQGQLTEANIKLAQQAQQVKQAQNTPVVEVVEIHNNPTQH